MRIFPVLCASGLHNIGSDLILNFIVENLPAPTEREPDRARSSTARKRTQKISESGLAPLFVFKTIADPFAGRITYLQGHHRHREERRQPAERHARHAPSAWRTSAARRARPCSR